MLGSAPPACSKVLIRPTPFTPSNPSIQPYPVPTPFFFYLPGWPVANRSPLSPTYPSLQPAALPTLQPSNPSIQPATSPTRSPPAVYPPARKCPLNPPAPKNFPEAGKSVSGNREVPGTRKSFSRKWKVIF